MMTNWTCEEYTLCDYEYTDTIQTYAIQYECGSTREATVNHIDLHVP